MSESVEKIVHLVIGCEKGPSGRALLCASAAAPPELIPFPVHLPLGPPLRLAFDACLESLRSGDVREAARIAGLCYLALAREVRLEPGSTLPENQRGSISVTT